MTRRCRMTELAPMDPITSASNPRVKRVMKWRKPRERRRDGVLIAEGRREVERAFAAGLEPVDCFFCPDLFDISGLAKAGDGNAARPRLLPTPVSADLLAKMAYHRKPEGVLAVFKAPRHTLESLGLSDRPLILVAVGSEKPGNLGAMVRSAAAAGCDAVLAVGSVVDVFNPNAIRNSTASVFTLPVVTVEDDAEAIDWLRSRGIRIAAALVDGTVPYHEADLAGPVALVVGPEHAGLNEAWRDAAEIPLKIVMPGSEGGGVVDSLNASTAAAVLLFEAVRQRST